MNKALIDKLIGYNRTDCRKLDRAIHAAYTKMCVWMDLIEDINIEQYKDMEVHYYHELYMFFIMDTGEFIDDWKLSANNTDKMFQYAIATTKKDEQKARAAKKASANT